MAWQEGAEGVGGAGSGPSKEAGTSLKCQRHHNSRGAKERLLAVLEAGKKSQPSLRERTKSPIHGPPARVSRAGGARRGRGRGTPPIGAEAGPENSTKQKLPLLTDPPFPK